MELKILEINLKNKKFSIYKIPLSLFIEFLKYELKDYYGNFFNLKNLSYIKNFFLKTEIESITELKLKDKNYNFNLFLKYSDFLINNPKKLLFQNGFLSKFQYLCTGRINVFFNSYYLKKTIYSNFRSNLSFFMNQSLIDLIYIKDKFKKPSSLYILFSLEKNKFYIINENFSNSTLSQLNGYKSITSLLLPKEIKYNFCKTAIIKDNKKSIFLNGIWKNFKLMNLYKIDFAFIEEKNFIKNSNKISFFKEIVYYLDIYQKNQKIDPTKINLNKFKPINIKKVNSIINSIVLNNKYNSDQIQILVSKKNLCTKNCIRFRKNNNVNLNNKLNKNLRSIFNNFNIDHNLYFYFKKYYKSLASRTIKKMDIQTIKNKFLNHLKKNEKMFLKSSFIPYINKDIAGYFKLFPSSIRKKLLLNYLNFKIVIDILGLCIFTIDKIDILLKKIFKVES